VLQIKDKGPKCYKKNKIKGQICNFKKIKYIIVNLHCSNNYYDIACTIIWWI
jgi:hypothetical protein